MKRNYILIIVSVAFISISCEKMILGPDEVNVPLPTIHDSKFETVVDSLRYALDLPALAAAIVTDTGIVESGAVGCRRYGGPENVTINDQFHLGSCGKSFTSVLMGILVDEGKVGWTTTLPEIFPEYANSMRTEYKDVTIRDLLSHTGGFMRSADITFHSSAAREQRQEVVAWALNQPPAQGHGKYLYSNLGYIIAGAVIEKLANSSYEELLMQGVIQPLGITTAGFWQMGIAGKEDEPLQHTPNHSPLVATPDAHLQQIYNPAGGLYMSVRDWGKYCQWVLACEAGHQTLLKPETAQMITTPFVSVSRNEEYALGWSVLHTDWAHGKALVHSGSNGYNYAEAALSSNRHFGVIAMTNQGSGEFGNPINPGVNRLIDFYLKGE